MRRASLCAGLLTPHAGPSAIAMPIALAAPSPTPQALHSKAHDEVAVVTTASRPQPRTLGTWLCACAAAFRPRIQLSKNVSVAGSDWFPASSTAITSTVLDWPEFP